MPSSSSGTAAVTILINAITIKNILHLWNHNDRNKTTGGIFFSVTNKRKTWRKNKAKRQFNDSYAEFCKWSFQKQYSKTPCSSLTSLCHGHKRSSCHVVGNKENIKMTQFGIELKWKIHHYCYWTHRCRLIEDKCIFLEVLYQLNDVSG